jgi:hypothetical protein
MKTTIASLLLAWMLCAVDARAQADTTFLAVEDSTDYDLPYKMGKYFSALDLSQTQTGFLYDKAIHFIEPRNHTGAPSAETGPFSSFETLCAIHHAFKMAWSGINTYRNPLFAETDSLRQRADSLKRAGKLPAALLYMEYDKFRDDAVARDLLVYNSITEVIDDVPGRPASPYVKAFTFTAALGVEELEQGIYTMQMLPSLIMHNTTKTISQLGVKINTGSYTYFQPGDNVTLDLTPYTGTIRLELRVWFTDATSLFDISKVTVLQKTNQNGPYSDATVSNTWNITPTGSHSGATVTIALGCDKQALTKPLIIVEPFDAPGSNRYTFRSTLDELKRSTAVSQALAEFETQGYDIVYIDFNNGTDYMERNAQIVKEVIRRVNTEKMANLSSEPNVVLGLSTGGVIARYGIRQMEIATEKHDTRLLMSLDAPHKGAYMPLNLQLALAQLEALDKNGVNVTLVHLTGPAAWMFLKFRKGIRITTNIDIFNMPQSMRDGLAMLTSPGAKQLFVCNIYDPLIVHINLPLGLGAFSVPTYPNNFYTGDTHKNFYNSYRSLGDLTQCREVGLTSGTINMQPQQFINTSNIPDNAIFAEAQENNSSREVLFKFIGLPNKEINKMVYIGKVKAKIPIIDKWENVLNWEVATNTADALPYDNAPGGYNNTRSLTGDLRKSMSLIGISGNSYSEHADRFSFVPTISSMNIETDNLYYDIAGDLSAQSPIPLPGLSGIVYYKPTGATIPFQTIAAPSTTTAEAGHWNTFHGIPTETNAGLIGLELLAASRLYNAIIGSYPVIPISINFGHNSTLGYSDFYASTGNTISTSLEFGRAWPLTGKLLINGHENIFGPTPDNPSRLYLPDANSMFMVSTTGESCGGDPITITMQNGTSLELGSVTDNRTGILNINNNATLKFEYGSSLVLHNKSKVIVRSGSTIEIDQYMDIMLTDSHCIIEFEPGSTLKLKNGFNFNFTGKGFIRINGGNSAQQVNIIGSVSITGDGPADKVIEFKRKSPANNKVKIPSSCTGFIAYTGKVTSDCEVTSDAYTVLNSCNMLGGKYYLNSTFYSQYSDWSVPDIYCFANSELTGGSITGQLHALNINQGSDRLTLYNVLFNQLESQGLSVYNSEATIIGTTFLCNHHPMQFDAISQQISLSSVTVNNSATYGFPSSGGLGISFNGATGGSLYLEKCNILNQQTSGVVIENAPLSISCSRVKTNTYLTGAVSIQLKNSASLLMDPALVYNGGRSDLSGYRGTIYSNLGEDIQINDAYSNLNCDMDAFEGTLTKDYSIGINDFYANNNYWKWGSGPTQLNHFYYFYYLTPNPYLPGVFDSKRFGNSLNGTVNAGSYLTTAPNLYDLCLLEDGGPGSGFGKNSLHYGINPDIARVSGVSLRNGKSLQDEALSVLSPEKQVSGAPNRLQTCASLIMEDYAGNTAAARPVVQMVYQKMQALLGEGISAHTIPYGKVSPETRLLLKAQDHLLHHGNLSQEKYFDVSMDRILTLRIEGRLQEAIKDLEKLRTEDLDKHNAFTGKWMCQLSLERDLHNGTITSKEFADRIAYCKTEDTKPAPPAYSESTETTSSRQAIETAGELSVFPNPATDEIRISWAEQMRPSRITLTDVNGKELLNATVPAFSTLYTIPVEKFASGIYFIKAEGNSTFPDKKITIVR